MTEVYSVKFVVPKILGKTTFRKTFKKVRQKNYDKLKIKLDVSKTSAIKCIAYLFNYIEILHN